MLRHSAYIDKQTPLVALIFFLLQRGKATIDLKKMLFNLIHLITVPFKGKPHFVFSCFSQMYHNIYGIFSITP